MEGHRTGPEHEADRSASGKHQHRHRCHIVARSAVEEGIPGRTEVVVHHIDLAGCSRGAEEGMGLLDRLHCSLVAAGSLDGPEDTAGRADHSSRSMTGQYLVGRRSLVVAVDSYGMEPLQSCSRRKVVVRHIAAVHHTVPGRTGPAVGSRTGLLADFSS